MDNIITFSESLKQVSEFATLEESKDISERLIKVLKNYSNGIGLSAIQIGIPKKVIVLKSEDNPEKFEVFINPEVVSAEDQFTFLGEGCLSYPGLYLNTKRYHHYTIKRQVIDGDKFREETDYFYYSQDPEERDSGLWAIAIQHEMDHLDGKTLPDYGFKTESLNTKVVKVGRNDPCPCGKTKPDGTPVKYKKCCGK